MGWACGLLVFFACALRLGDGLNESSPDLKFRHFQHSGRSLAKGPHDASHTTCGAERGPISELACGEWWLTNCTSQEAMPACPDRCPYRAASPVFGCLFTCVTADRCSKTNAQLAFPEKETHICQPCSVAACAVCSSRNTCERCQDKFVLYEKDHYNIAACIYYVDENMHFDWWSGKAPSIWNWVVSVTLCAILIGLLLGIVRLCMKELPDKKKEDLQQALQHRRHVKVHAWGDISKHVNEFSRLVDLFADVHNQDLIGVGFAFFYRDVCFTLTWTAFAWLMMFSANYLAGLRTGAQGNQSMWTFMTAMLKNDIYDLTGCAEAHDSLLLDFEQELVLFHFYALWILYFVTVVVSGVYLAWSRSLYLKFISESKPLFTHCAMMSGFPEDATVEKDIVEAIERHHHVEIIGVSILYEMKKVADRLEAMLDDHLLEQEIKLDGHDDEIAAIYPIETVRDIEAEVRSWLAEKQVVNSGEVVCIFKAQADATRVIDQNNATPLSWPWLGQEKEGFLGSSREVSAERLRDSIIHFTAMHREPTMISWLNIYRSHNGRASKNCRKLLRVLCAIAVSALFMILVGVIFYGPAVWYNALHAYEAGSIPDAGARIALGSLVAIANAFMIPALINMSKLAKFVYRDKEEVFTCVLVTIFFVWNSAFNLFWIPFDIQVNGGWDLMHGFNRDLVKDVKSMAKTSSHLLRHAENLRKRMDSLKGMILLEKIAAKVWGCMAGGMFGMFVFIPIILFAFPYIGGLLSLKMTERDMRRGEVERLMEPFDMNLGVDSAGLLANCIICVSGFILMASQIWKFMAVLLIWICCYYCFCRYIHLRGFKSAFYHSTALASVFHCGWHVVIALVLAAACRHGYHLRYWPWWISLVAPLSHLFLMAPIYTCLSRHAHFEHVTNSDSYMDIRRGKTYSWFNVNPILVMKSLLKQKSKHKTDLPDKQCYDNLVYFNVGKQYLQPNLKHALETTSNSNLSRLRQSSFKWTEAEHYVDRAAQLLQHGSSVNWHPSSSHTFTRVAGGSDTALGTESTDGDTVSDRSPLCGFC